LSASGDDGGEGGSLLASGVRLVMRPARALAGSVGVAPAAELTVDELLAGPLPEMIGRSIGEHRVIERVVTEAAKADDFAASISSALESERTTQILEDVLASPALERALRGAGDRMLQSPEFERLLRAVLTSPEVRHALTRQTASLGADAAAGARRRTVPLDASAEATVHRWLRRPPQAAAAISYGGFVTRGLALVVDILLVAVMFAVGVALVNAVGDVLGGHLRPAWLVDALAGSGFALAFAVYFAGFWATAGQTPGMRLLGLRVVSYAHAPLGLGRSLVRLVALALSILLCFAGFLPALVDNRRRTLHDFLARTLVIYDERVTVD
jgi:uncharacterized RDD family membrane protein YckC